MHGPAVCGACGSGPVLRLACWRAGFGWHVRCAHTVRPARLTCATTWSDPPVESCGSHAPPCCAPHHRSTTAASAAAPRQSSSPHSPHSQPPLVPLPRGGHPRPRPLPRPPPKAHPSHRGRRRRGSSGGSSRAGSSRASSRAGSRGRRARGLQAWLPRRLQLGRCVGCCHQCLCFPGFGFAMAFMGFVPAAHGHTPPRACCPTLPYNCGTWDALPCAGHSVNQARTSPAHAFSPSTTIERAMQCPFPSPPITPSRPPALPPCRQQHPLQPWAALLLPTGSQPTRGPSLRAQGRPPPGAC